MMFSWFTHGLFSQLRGRDGRGTHHHRHTVDAEGDPGALTILPGIDRFNIYCWLVVEPYPSEKYEFVNGDDYSQYMGK